MKAKTHIVGLDMATGSNKQGVAVGMINAKGMVEVLRVGKGGELAKFLNKYSPALLAIDSPLGWPVSMREALCGHRAGEKITTLRNSVFRRKTDEFIGSKLSGINPLEVGADKIAKTAHAACELIGKGGELNDGRGIPVLLSPGVPERLSAIEVYPAATWFAHGWGKPTRYKGGKNKAEERKKREEMVRKLRDKGSIALSPDAKSSAESDDDILDACICLLAARDFLDGECYTPKDANAEEAAKIEGWIWVKRGDCS